MSHTSATHLRIDGISKTFGDRRVLTDISFTVPDRDRVGIIGENGSGKTTLLRIIAGELEPDAGTVESFATAQSGLQLGLLHQQLDFVPETTVATVIETAVINLRDIEREVTRAAAELANNPDSDTVMQHYSQTVELADQLGVWDIDSRIETTLTGLGLTNIDRHRAIRQLSGGQRSRLALASLLLSTPEALLLDEPTNHLDDDAVDYLTGVITQWKGPVLIVSHDRAFLDHAVESIVDLDPAPRPHTLDETADHAHSIGVTRFGGTYSQYLEARRDDRRRWQQQYDDEQAQLKKLRAAVDEHQVVGHRDWKPRTEVRMAQKYYADRNAKVVARRVNDARSRLNELQQRQIVKPPEQLTFHGLTAAGVASSGSDSNEPLVVADQVGLQGRLAPTTLTIGANDKLLITGANGAGKSTLLRILAGQLDPDQGTIQHRNTVRIGFLGQETSFDHFEDATAATVYQELVGFDRAQRVPLATFGLLHPRDEHRSVQALSTGQQRRLALAAVLADPPQLLLLDEPTNHLSLLLATELEASIAQYPGTIVLASHDRWLRDRWTAQHHSLDSVAGSL